MMPGKEHLTDGGCAVSPELPVIELKQAGPEAAALLAVLHQASFAGKETWDEAAFRQILDMPGVVVWLACVGESLSGQNMEPEVVPAGFVITRHVLDEGEILSLGVHPRWQRRGIARKLLQHILNGARQAGDTLFLEVRVSNEAAARLYGQVGFQQVAVRSRYYEDGEDARLLRWMPG